MKENEIENLLNKLEDIEESFKEVEKREDKLRNRESEVVEQLFEKFSNIAQFVGEKATISYMHPGGQGQSAKRTYDSDNSILIGKVVYTGEEIDYTKIGNGKAEQKNSFNQDRGDYGGTVYRLYPDGNLRKIEYTGGWSNWQGESSSYKGEKKEAEIKELLKIFEIEDVLKSLKKRIEDAVKENENKKKYIGSRLKTVEAVEKVLEL